MPGLLGADSRHVELVAIATNPVFYQQAYTQAFTRQEGLAQVPNWLFLTGPLPALRQVWRDYGIDAEVEPAGSMVGHLLYLGELCCHERPEQALRIVELRRQAHCECSSAWCG